MLPTSSDADDDDRVERPAMAEHRVATRTRRCPSTISPRISRWWPDLRPSPTGRRTTRSTQRRRRVAARSNVYRSCGDAPVRREDRARRGAARSAPRRPRRRGTSASGPSRPSAPMNPTSDAAERRPTAGSRGSSSLPSDPAGVVERPGQGRGTSAGRGRGSASPPARREREPAAVVRHPARTSPSGRPGRDDVRPQLVLGEGVAQGAGALGGQLARPPGPGGSGSPLAAPGPRGRPGRRPPASSVTTTHATPRARSAASGRTHDGSSEAVMTTAVIPRRSAADGRDERLDERRALPSASTAARSCMIFRCWRPPRSAGRNAVRPALTVMPDRAVLAGAPCRRSTPPPGSPPRPSTRRRGRPGRARWRSRMIQASAVCSRSNSLTWISPWRAVVFQWIRFIASPGAYGRTVVASGVVWSVRSRRRRGCPRGSPPAGASSGSGSSRG